MLGQKVREQLMVADIALGIGVILIGLKRGEISQVARVGEIVEVDAWFIVLFQPIDDEVGPDKSGTAGNKNGHTSTASLLNLFQKRCGNQREIAQ